MLVAVRGAMAIFDSEADISVLYVLTALCFADVLSGAAFERDYAALEWYQEARRYTRVTKRLPAWLFGVVWSALYVLFITALYLVYNAPTPVYGRTLDIIALAALVEIVLNKLWSPVFFTLHAPWVALFVVVAMNALNGLILAYMWYGAFYPQAFWVYVPYAAWCLFALVLNAEWLWAESRLRHKQRCQAAPVVVV